MALLGFEGKVSVNIGSHASVSMESPFSPLKQVRKNVLHVEDHLSIIDNFFIFATLKFNQYLSFHSSSNINS